MSDFVRRPLIATVIVFLSTAALGQEPPPGVKLNVVTVAAPPINCTYSPICSFIVTDSIGQLTLQNLDKPNTAWLQSRTFTGLAGTPGAGKFGYEYRLDMTQASGALQCVGGIVINFGPISQLPFKNNSLADVYVITEGGLGTIGLNSAYQNGNVITFNFSRFLCPSEPANAANTTFFFGLASVHPPVATTAGVFVTASPPFYVVPARAPQH
jgi:hypothetical protein